MEEDKEITDKQEWCYICDRQPWGDEDDGFGFVHKDLLIYDEEDIKDYQDEKGCLTKCNKCDDFFREETSYTFYKSERLRIEKKLIDTRNELAAFIEIYKMVGDIPIEDTNKVLLLKKIQERLRGITNCITWLDIPENHVKMKRFIRG